MLASLSVRNVLLFQNQQIEFGDGLNVLTGETGAGKSMLLDCLGFVLGERKSPGLFSSMNRNSEAAAVFRLPDGHAANAVLDEFAIQPMEELVLRRVISPSGRISSFVNDSRCTAGVLSRLAHVLIESHGQDSSRSQMKPSEHRALLDAFADAGVSLRQVRDSWRKLQDAKSDLDRAERGRAEAENETAFLRQALDEINDLNPQAGEEERLSARRSELKSFLRHQEDLLRAAEAIGASGAEGQASDAIRWLQNAGAGENDSVREAADSVDRAIVELNEASRLLDGIRSRFDADPHEVERVEERLHAIRRLARKHSTPPDGLTELSAKFTALLDRMRDQIAEAGEIPDRVRRLEQDYHEHARRLSAIRRAAAKRLDRMVGGELPALKLNAARFRADVSSREARSDGQDSVVFTASTNASTPSGPIHQIASGGEFSRFMLALKVCLTSRNSGITMIFDEVDRDVGGATADAVGRRLRSLAADTQVLAVTHSPQVAAYGDCHLRIEKHAARGTASANVVRLSGRQRVNEIARMLSGETVTGEAEAAAASLLKDTQSLDPAADPHRSGAQADSSHSPAVSEHCPRRADRTLEW